MSEHLRSLVRSIPDFPKPGILFRDITTLLKDPEGLRGAVNGLASGFAMAGPDKVLGIESRGFILGGAVALALDAGFIPARKPGKLPAETLAQDYELEYGVDRLELHRDAISPGERVLIIDDLIATGGTAEAAARLVLAAGGVIAGFGFVIELPDLGGRGRLAPFAARTLALLDFPGH